jgi:hypothetical protein
LIFGINFVAGVVTGIPMEFQFGTNWARFSQLTGGLIGQPLAMEGVFSFFLESAFLALFLFGEARLSRLGHSGAGFLVFLGSWLSVSLSSLRMPGCSIWSSYERLADRSTQGVQRVLLELPTPLFVWREPPKDFETI